MRLFLRPGPALILLTLILGACGGSSDTETVPPNEETVVDRPALAEVLRRHSPEIIGLEGVEAIYEARTKGGEPCVRIGVRELTEELRERLPRRLEGWPVEIEEIGEIRPMDDEG